MYRQGYSSAARNHQLYVTSDFEPQSNYGKVPYSRAHHVGHRGARTHNIWITRQCLYPLHHTYPHAHTNQGQQQAFIFQFNPQKDISLHQFSQGVLCSTENCMSIYKCMSLDMCTLATSICHAVKNIATSLRNKRKDWYKSQTQK